MIHPRFKRTIPLLLLLLTMGACATPTPYAPVTEKYGYKDSGIEQNRYRVTFSGNSITDRETVENYLLYRAAELTREKGGTYFTVVDRDLEKKERYYSYNQWPFGYGGYGYYGFYGGYYVRHSLYPGPTDNVPITRYEAIAEILIGGDEMAGQGPNTYKAADVLVNLGPKIVRPQK